MTKEELDVILAKHRKWLNREKDGIRADFREVNFSYVDLSYVDLSYADLSYANFRHANLCEVDFRGANLSYAGFYGADLHGAKLYGASLCGASLCGAKNIPFLPQTIICPEDGTFIGFKKLNDKIIKLEIPADAKRSSATTRKCRCEFAKVISITNFDGSDSGLKEIINDNHIKTIYKIGEMVYPDSFDEDRWNECSHGIHFFMTRQEAIEYQN